MLRFDLTAFFDSIRYVVCLLCDYERMQEKFVCPVRLRYIWGEALAPNPLSLIAVYNTKLIQDSIKANHESCCFRIPISSWGEESSTLATGSHHCNSALAGESTEEDDSLLFFCSPLFSSKMTIVCYIRNKQNDGVLYISFGLGLVSNVTGPIDLKAHQQLPGLYTKAHNLVFFYGLD